MPAAPSKASLLVVFLTVFIDLLGFGLVLPLLPIYADLPEFGADAAGWMIGGLMASFSVMQFLCAPLWGRLSDRIGRRPVLMIGLGGSVVFYTLFGLASVWKSLPLLLASRIGAGTFGATIPTAQAYIADCTSLENRPKGMALIGMAFGMGFTFGPLFGFLAVPAGHGDPGPGPGYAAAGLSAVALLLALFKLPESLRPGSQPAARKMLDFAALRAALATPSVGLILVSIFVCVFSFANFETTISMLIKESQGLGSPFDFQWREVCLTYAYIGLTLAIVQGGFVRRLAGRIHEGTLAAFGALVQIFGFGLITQSITAASTGMLLAALAVVVTGFAFMQPMLNSLLSRRTDPRRQGGIFGIGQSASSLARILGSLVGIPLLKMQTNLPFYVAAGLMSVGFLLVLTASRSGRDFAESAA